MQTRGNKKAYFSDIDEVKREVTISFSSEIPVKTENAAVGVHLEILSHREGDINFERIQDGGPVLYKHGGLHIGAVRSVWVEGEKAYARVIISDRDKEVQGYWRDIVNGILRNVSVGYLVGERERVPELDKDGVPAYRCTWTPYEISFLPIPEDHTVGVGREFKSNEKRKIMKRSEIILALLEQQGGFRGMPTPEEAMALAESLGLSAEEVQAAIDEVYGAEEEVMEEDVVVEDLDETDVIEREYEEDEEDEEREMDEEDEEERSFGGRNVKIRKRNFGYKPTGRSGHISMGVSSKEKFKRAATEVLMSRAGLANHNAQNNYNGYSLIMLAQESLRQAGVKTTGFDVNQIAQRAITHSSSDFSTLLADVASKALLKGFDETEETYEAWTTVVSFRDFKPQYFTDLSEVSGLEEVREGGEYTHGTFVDHGENFSIKTFGRMFSIARQALINDDLGAMTRVPQEMGRAAKRLEGDIIYNDNLAANPLMGDGIALFEENTHLNLVVTGSGAPPSVATLTEAKVAMALQKGRNSQATLNIQPAFIIVPKALEDLAMVLISSIYDHTTTSGGAGFQQPNPHANSLQVIAEHRLDAISTTAWYMVASPGQFDTMARGYLNGNQAPSVKQQDSWIRDGTEFKVSHDFNAKALEWKTFYKNEGA